MTYHRHTSATSLTCGEDSPGLRVGGFVFGAEMKKEAETYTVEICIAGEIADAIRVCREFCLNEGFCVTVTPTTYVYTGGSESGVIVRCINYPRFPTSPGELLTKAQSLAERLRLGLCQHSFSLIAPDKTLWVTVREQ